MSDEEKKSKQSLVTVSAEWHRRLLDIAAERTAAKGKRVTIREIVEAALCHAFDRQDQFSYGQLHIDGTSSVLMNEEIEPPECNICGGVATADPCPGCGYSPSSVLFAKLFEAAFMANDSEIEKLNSAAAPTIAGSAGQRIKLGKLAYYLRETTAEIATLQDLVKAFEEGR